LATTPLSLIVGDIDARQFPVFNTDPYQCRPQDFTRKVLPAGVEAEKTKTEKGKQRQQARKLKARRKKKTIYISLAVGLVILSIVILMNSQSPPNSGSGSSNFTTKASPNVPGPVSQSSPNYGKDDRIVDPGGIEWDSAKPLIPEQPLPRTGSARKLTADESVAPFQIKADQGAHYLVKLVDAHSGFPALTVFVRSGTTVDIKVPL